MIAHVDFLKCMNVNGAEMIMKPRTGMRMRKCRTLMRTVCVLGASCTEFALQEPPVD